MRTAIRLPQHLADALDRIAAERSISRNLLIEKACSALVGRYSPGYQTAIRDRRETR